MDIPTLSYVYEGFDHGYTAYVGFQVVRKTHTHPVALSFISLLLDARKKNLRKNSGKSNEYLRAQVQQNTVLVWLNCSFQSNWHLAYSIINNPSLRLYRKHYQESDKSQSEATGDKIELQQATKTTSEPKVDTNHQTTSIAN